MQIKYLIGILSLVLVSCASNPLFDSARADLSLTPQSVNAEPQQTQGKTALWGGTILNVQNLQNFTQLEILAYPLDSSQRPLVNRKPLGRFLIRKKGFLEPENYSQGRLLTVLGKLEESEKGVIGESTYQYPVLNASQLQLWSAGDKNKTRFSFGLGIRL